MVSLRIQKRGGGQEPWTLNELSEGLKKFHQEHGRYPTATEVDSYKYLPSARSIERSFGGLVALRKQLGLSKETDFRMGSHSSKRALAINKRAHQIEARVYTFLQETFGREFVHREYFFTDDRRTRADFFVYDGGKGFCVDVFYPSNKRNLTGCLNDKLNKYRTEYMHQYPVIFLQMNGEISQEVLDLIAKNKKKVLHRDQKLMSWESFQGFCKSRTPLRVAK